MGNWRKLGIIAGDGDLPIQVAKQVAERGNDIHVIVLDTVSDHRVRALADTVVSIGQVGKIINTLKSNNCDAVVLAGYVKRPDFKNLKLDMKGASLLPRAIRAAKTGDGSLLSFVVEVLEQEGFIVIGAHELSKTLIIAAGALGKFAPNEEQIRDIRKGAALISALGAFDVGQATVVADGFVLAIEAVEGTDAMLRRCAAVTPEIRGEEANGVLVKRTKPGQELRVDLPTIGVNTVQASIEANLKGIAVEAGKTIILEPSRVAELADKHGLYVYAFCEHEV
ncbi:MAG: UDP-2,3-diacylglucosamine diphosphatase LpxI [Parvularculaceae bacterium]|nr:UDP-2,3-diacylglucosamine diphosphatase LpxI [Parvularculaceae bacterium]